MRISGELSSPEDILAGYHEWVEEAYRLGQEYENKGRIGKFLMRLMRPGRRSAQLESGRVAYANRPEARVAAHNKEVIKSWPK